MSCTMASRTSPRASSGLLLQLTLFLHGISLPYSGFPQVDAADAQADPSEIERGSTLEQRFVLREAEEARRMRANLELLYCCTGNTT